MTSFSRVKRFLVSFLILLTSFNVISAQNEQSDPKAYLEGLPVIKKRGRPTIGLVLCGGGAKGAAHIGAIKVLEDNGVPIDLVVGTSMGALVGGMYSMGYTAHQMDSIISNCDWKYLLSDKTDRTDVSFTAKQIDSKFLLNIPFRNILKRDEGGKREKSNEGAVDYILPSGLIEGQNVYNLISSLSMGYQDSVDFLDMPIPFACVATELATGYPIVLRNGNLPLSLRASMAIPGFFSAVTINNRVLVDGGTVDNFPVDVARKMGADIVIGVDIQNPLAKNSDLQSINQIVSQLIALTGNELYLENVKDVDLLIKPDVLNFSTFSFNKPDIDSLIKNGYIAALEKSDEIKSLVKKYGRVSKNARLQAPAAKEISNQFFYVEKIYMRGIRTSDIYWLKGKLKIKENSFIQGHDILKAVSILYGTKAFANVSYDIYKNPKTSKSTLVFNLKKGPANVLGLSAKYDSEEAAAILLYVGMNVNSLNGAQLGITGRLSYNPYAKVDFAYLFRNLPRINLNYTFRSTNMNIYESDENRKYLSFLYNKVDFSISNRYLRNFNLSFGARIETYKYRDLMEPYSSVDYYKKGVAYLSYYFSGRMDTRDASYFPTRGTVFNVDVIANHTNFRDGFVPSIHLISNFEHVFSPSDVVSIIPSFYSGFLIGNSHQLPFKNYIGGAISGRYMPHQMPFIGINYADIFPDAAAIARIDFRVRVAPKHYLYAIGNYARYGESLNQLWQKAGDGMYGAGIKYAYDTPLGPLSFNVHYSDFNDRVGAYVNIGYYF